MLQHLIENFTREFIESFRDDEQAVLDCLAKEKQKLSDIEHLERNVIGKALLEWDYRAIDDGFLNLMDRFMKSQSYTPLLFISVLRELGCDPARYIKASMLLEYSYYAICVIDYFDFHKVFTEKERNLLKYAELTQDRYAAQYLIQYPRYMVINNTFELGARQNIELHKHYAAVGVTTGTGRGVFLKWANSYFKGIKKEKYYQNCVHLLNNFFLFPVTLAAIFAKVSDEDRQRLENGFSALTVFAKLRLEKRVYLGEKVETEDDACSDLMQLLTFPGMALVTGELEIDPSVCENGRYPWVTGMNAELMEQVATKRPEKALKEIEKAETELFGTFMREVGKTGLLGETVERLRKCYSM